MKLYWSPTSPFVRKVMVTAHELGLADRIETELLRPSPTKIEPELSRHNPLSKIPALVLDDGSTLYDSAVICEYLGSLAEGSRLVPATGPERFRVLTTAALCDGILEAGIQVFYERNHRPADKQYEPWLAGQTQKVVQGLDALERLSGGFGETVDLGQIAAGCTLGWLEFRSVVGELWEGRPALKAWYGRFAERPSMVATAPR